MTSSLSRMRTAALAMIDGLRIVLVAIAVCLYGLGGTVAKYQRYQRAPYLLFPLALRSDSGERGATPPLGGRLGGGAADFVLGCGRDRRASMCAISLAALRSLMRLSFSRRGGLRAKKYCRWALLGDSRMSSSTTGATMSFCALDM